MQRIDTLSIQPSSTLDGFIREISSLTNDSECDRACVVLFDIEGNSKVFQFGLEECDDFATAAMLILRMSLGIYDHTQR